MRRWNGCGEESVRYPVAEPARRFLESRPSPGTRPKDAALEDVTRRSATAGG